MLKSWKNESCNETVFSSVLWHAFECNVFSKKKIGIGCEKVEWKNN